ncbi:hypothetical protein COY27_02260 [Candidatus Woesearchaeota archaeon CG_4_10_14_0_2_um_filter_33_13]|nr:MAG: hypothetical protein COY27_02260 [Candidatus Woesearchaeota archaeon CG_4_10_14_0_2_um_filter_33_13]
MIIGKKRLKQEHLQELIKQIKQKKELKELSDEYIQDYLYKFFQQEIKLFNQIVDDFNPKSANYKRVLKEVRAKLRRVYGLFRVEDQATKRREIIELYFIQPENEQLIKDILATHSSTKERLPFYEQLYKKIFAITKIPKSIIDLGCGINPFSIQFMQLKELKYLAYDLSEEEIGFIKRYFSLLHQQDPSFNGEAHILDALRWTRLLELPIVDICFLFKMTDVLDQGKGHKKSEEIIKAIPAKYVVVSFPTLTMSGKKMNHPRKGWIELVCKRLNYKFRLLEFSNELFYVINKGVK